MMVHYLLITIDGHDLQQREVKKNRKDQSTSYRPHTPVLAFLIRASFMLFQHKHPRIYETRSEGGEMPKAGRVK